MTGCRPSSMDRNTSARRTRPSSMAMGTSQSMRMPSRTSERDSSGSVVMAGPRRAFDASHPLQHDADGRGVLARKPEAYGRGVDRLCGAEQGRGRAELLREGADDRHILLPSADPHGGRFVAVVRHHGRAQLENAGGRGSRADQLDDLMRVEPRLDPEHHRLRRGDVVDRDEKISYELHSSAVPESADIVRRAGETGE